jgi:hypothetical protein
MKDYNTETDIITIPDPLFYPGDKVDWSFWEGGDDIKFIVESFSWNTLAKSWTYTLVYFLSGNYDLKWNGSLAAEEVLEKEVKLVSRQRKEKVC